ncbi:hypothetical protein P4E94_13345 [Pontiellaceae bacterium B12219]|nr:hypothetical protein [Pontiellaceae bacterium B12219]
MSSRTTLSTPGTPYKEESIKIPAGVTVVLLVLICIPLLLWILRINEEGARATNTAKYDAMVAKVQNDAQTVDALLRNDAAELEAMRAAKEAVTLIVPEIVIVEEKKEPEKIGALKVNIDGIYWSPKNPLVSIGDETYRIGDVVQGYEIVRINKTTVHFQAPDGTLVVQDMYEDLLHK